MTPEQCRQYRAIGGQLALYLRQRQGGLPAPATLQAVAADLAADQAELVLPLRDLVIRPGFAAVAAKAGSGGGVLERQALLQAMEATFAPAVIAALSEILAGCLDLPSVASSAGPAAGAESTSGDQPAQPQPQPSPEPAPTPSPVPPARGTAGCAGPALIAIAVAGGLVVAGVVVAVVSTPQLCAAVRLCPQAGRSSASQQALDAAAAAEQALRRAQGLTDYRQATEQLERELLRLSGDALSAEQQRQRQQLQTTANQARSILQAEEADLKRLEQAQQALATARAAGGEERNRQIAAARQVLAQIPPRSFSAAQANGLLEQLAELERSAAAPAEPAPDTPTPAPADPVPPASPRWSPPATQRAPSPAPAELPNRDQPLF